MDKRFFSCLAACQIFAGSLLAKPSIENLVPYYGTSAGGSSISIQGKGFSDAVQVYFDQTPAQSFRVESDDLIIATTPAHVPQVTFVSVVGKKERSDRVEESAFVFQGDYLINLNLVDLQNTTKVAVFDKLTEQVVTTTTGTGSPSSLAITPDGSLLLSLNRSAGELSVLSQPQGKLLYQVSTGKDPLALVIDSNQKNVYVINSGSHDISVIDLSLRSLVRKIAVGLHPVSLVISSDGTKLYVANQLSQDVSIIDLITFQSSKISLSNQPIALCLSQDQTKLYVALSGVEGSLSVIDLSTNEVVEEVSLGEMPSGIVIGNLGRGAVLNRTESTISLLHFSETTEVEAKIPIEGFVPGTMAISPDGRTIYVGDLIFGTIDAIDVMTKKVKNLYRGFSKCFLDMALTPDGSMLYATDDTGNLIVIDTKTAKSKVISFLPAKPRNLVISADQAPLARFSAQIATPGTPSYFDAKESIAPIGKVVRYLWDFGDGFRIDTNATSVVHTYQSPGKYKVSLKVISSSGTSTEESSKEHLRSMHEEGGWNLSVTPSSYLTGGSSALSSRFLYVGILPLPPLNAQGAKWKNRFLTQIDHVNRISWSAPNGGAPIVGYKIYRDGLNHLIATLPASSLFYEDHNRNKGRIHTYYIVSVDDLGNLSDPLTITL